MSERIPGASFAASVVALFACACTGGMDRMAMPRAGAPDDVPSIPGGPAQPGQGGPPGTISPGAASSEMPLRLTRLARAEYGNTLRDLLGDDTDVASELPVDTAGDTGFAQPGPVGALEAQRFMELAEAAATRAARRLPELMGCDVSKAEATCIASFLPSFLKRAYRRPATADEMTAARAHYDRVRALRGQDAIGATRALLSAILQSPALLYRWELGPKRAPKPGAGGTIALDDYELGSRLSYFITGSMPDETLFAAADQARLRDPAVLASEARRLLGSPRARQTVRALHEQWLALAKIRGTEKDTTVYKGFGDELRSAMESETHAFIDHVVFEGDGKLDTLFSADFSFVNAALAKVYGVTGVTGTALKKQMLNPEQRFGLMTHGSFLATHAYPHDSAPVKRGVAIRQALLCQSVPAPPNDVVVTPPTPDPKKSVREQFEQHSTDPACKGCHQLFDSLGFAFENYDGIGAYRTAAAGRPVDASGVTTGIGAGTTSFRNLRELMTAVRTSQEFRDCVAGTWLRYAIGRRETAADEPGLKELRRSFASSGYDLRELIVAVVQSPSFRFRTPSAGEVLQ